MSALVCILVQVVFFVAHEGKYITFEDFDCCAYADKDVIGFWNATLEGWVIPPNNQALIKEMMEVKARKEN